MKKPFKLKVDITGSTRFELLHYKNNRVRNILLMTTQQVPKKNKQWIHQQNINRKKHHTNTAFVRDLKLDLADFRIRSQPFKFATNMPGTLSPYFSQIQRLVNRETLSKRHWLEKKTAAKEPFLSLFFSC